MKNYPHIRKELERERIKQKKEAVELIKKGFLKIWAPDFQKPNDEELKRHLTATKWEAYQNGKIKRTEAVKIAVNREWREINKRFDTQLQRLAKLESAEISPFIKISIEWKKSAVWGYNPFCEVWSISAYTRGKATGCGYDKESASISDATYNNCSIIKVLCEMEERRLTMRNKQPRREALGYGSGYGVIPYLEGGVGASCHIKILKKYGYQITEAHGKTYDYYEARL